MALDEKIYTSTDSNSSADIKPKKKGNIFKRAFLHHYRDAPYIRSEKKLESQKYLIFNIPFNRWILFPVAVLIQFCCGSLYAWSIYNKPIDKAITGDPNANDAPITFYLAVCLLGFSAAAMGPVLERRGPRFGAIIGSCCFLVGHLLTALGIHTKQMWLVYVSYGIIGGYGLGFSYISPVSALQKWFPDHRGMAAGFAVCGFGAGSIAFGKIPLPIIDAVGLPKTFIIMGCIYFVIMFPCAMILRVPPPGYTVNGLDVNRQKIETVETSIEEGEKPTQVQAVANSQPKIEMTLVESLLDRDFRLLYLLFFANSTFGLVVISRLSNMVVDIFGKSPDVASTIVAANGGFNLAGRLAFSILSDYIGRKTCVLTCLVVQCVVIGIVSISLDERIYGLYIALIWIASVCYGAGFGIIPAFLTDMYGPKNIGACHGIILTAWSISGVGGGLLFTGIFDRLVDDGYSSKDPYLYIINLWWILAIAIAGFFCAIFVRTTLRDRLLPAVPGQILRLRVFGRVLRVTKDNGLRVRLLSKQQELMEWNQFTEQLRAKHAEEEPLVQ
ncbi:hypothetical protein IWQ62_004932 [Dispira parvispora]|uniref:Uncharacterized protein n=1 Tax=Dispira parvispora TaxID=1520584 RepID=A0A9W8E4Z2_9FUNG|nr:hypothetical protein IWQ62_004932 [Dispira parvispora]